MELKLVKVPFEVELAKKITEKSVEGRIVTRDGENVRIVSFDRKDEYRPIIVLIKKGDIENVYALGIDGKEISGDTIGANDLMLEIPEYMTFKDGNILTYWPNGNRWCIFIYKSRDKDVLSNHVSYDCDSRGNNILTFGKSSYNSTLCDISTEAEKKSLIEALKASKDPRAKEYLKRFFNIEQKQECEFKPFDKVLVKDHDEDSEWRCGLFSHKNEDGLYICVGSIYEQCIPYEGNEHLLGTTDKMEEK